MAEINTPPSVETKKIDKYIAAFPPSVRVRIKRMRQTIRKAAPAAEEKMSYGMPAFKLGRMLVYYAAWKAHIGFYFASRTVLATFKKELDPFEVSKGTIKFPLGKPLPLGLITKIVKHRMSENLANRK